MQDIDRLTEIYAKIAQQYLLLHVGSKQLVGLSGTEAPSPEVVQIIERLAGVSEVLSKLKHEEFDIVERLRSKLVGGISSILGGGS